MTRSTARGWTRAAALTVTAGWVTAQMEAPARQVMAPERYIAAVLGGVR